MKKAAHFKLDDELYQIDRSLKITLHSLCPNTLCMYCIHYLDRRREGKNIAPTITFSSCHLSFLSRCQCCRMTWRMLRFGSLLARYLSFIIIFGRISTKNKRELFNVPNAIFHFLHVSPLKNPINARKYEGRNWEPAAGSS